MRLFKCWKDHAEEKEDFVITWAKDENEAKEKIVALRSQDDWFYDYVFEDMNFQEFLEIIKGKESELFSIINDEDELVKFIYRNTELHCWTVDEYYYNPRMVDVFACFPKDIVDHEDIQIVSVPFDAVDPEEVIYSELASRLADDEFLRSYVEQPCIDGGLAEMFWKDTNGRYVFDEFNEMEIRNDIVGLFDGNMEAANKFIHSCFYKNVREFFSEAVGLDYAEQYLFYIKHYDPDADIKLEFDHDFYEYCSRKLLESGKYITYEIEQVI